MITRGCRAAGVLLAAGALAACSHAADSPPPGASPSAEPGTTVTAQGVARWSTAQPGCTTLTTDSGGVVYRLSGHALEEFARTSGLGVALPPDQHVLVRGRVTPPQASACGGGSALELDSITTTP
jgi:hypothetical protein